MYFFQPLARPLPFPSSVATVSSPSISPSVVVVVVVLVREFAPTAVVVVVLVHPVPFCCCCWLRSLESARTLASRRWAAGRAVTRIAALAECAKEADLTRVNLCLRLRALLRPLHLDDEDRVALAVLPSFRLHHTV